MSCLPMFFLARFCFDEVRKESEVGQPTLLHYCGTTSFLHKPASSRNRKNVLPASKKSKIIYQFSCHCDSRYVGRTSQRLQDTIKQHIPKSIHSGVSSQKRALPARDCKSSSQSATQHFASDSAIGVHLLQNPTCAQHYDDSRFSILAKRRSPFHLSAFKATFFKTALSFQPITAIFYIHIASFISAFSF